MRAFHNTSVEFATKSRSFDSWLKRFRCLFAVLTQFRFVCAVDDPLNVIDSVLPLLWQFTGNVKDVGDVLVHKRRLAVKAAKQLLGLAEFPHLWLFFKIPHVPPYPTETYPKLW